MKPNRSAAQELAAYDRAVQAVVRAARRKFKSNQDGKFGWDDPNVWATIAKTPLERARLETREAESERWDLRKRTEELGDALNFLAFDRAAEVSKRRE